MVSQISLECEVCPRLESIGNKDGESSSPTSLQDHDAPQMPVQKPTRQWAAWTRQEEELFFAALRQVGKNFEKITRRVQSKNKDQVRHYYYRLVRRMNKLLGPELSLDAKNSKDTISAMLRWWSLLEKYSCKASKLHLKPRRFKIFIEALENQLLKDRKKTIRKRPTGEDNSSMAHGPAPAECKVSGHDNRAVKIVHVDSHDIQKVGTGKGSLLRHNVNIGTNHSNCKGDPTSTQTEKKRKKTGLVATSAYKRWEKAAIAGVSLVADAAEHLERVDTDNEIQHAQETPGHDVPQNVEKVSHQQNVVKMLQSLPVPPQCILNENNIQNSAKLKLQLFPIDERTRKALEMDNHNPHLELTLSTRKKISSIVDHLNRKWGNSSLLSQELMLFPYWAQRENLVGYQKWTKDSPLCAEDIYYLIGSPPVFRLRYGWFSKAEVELATAQALSGVLQNAQSPYINVEKVHNSGTERPSGALDDVSAEQRTALTSNRETRVLAAARQGENTKDITSSAGDLADSLTTISVRDFLSDSIQNMDVISTEFSMPATSNFQQLPFSCDSFDAAIAAHIYKHQNKVDLQQGLASHGSSIWDAEETRDAFAFQKHASFCHEVQNPSRIVSPEACNNQTNIRSNPSASHKETEGSTLMEKLNNIDPTCGYLVDECRPVHTSDNLPKDYGGLTDIYWPDSLGPLDLDIPSRRYHNDDLILSDSLGGLSRLVASSMDSFQSCSFLELDKREADRSTGEVRQPSSFLDFKISSQV